LRAVCRSGFSSLSLHDALPILVGTGSCGRRGGLLRLGTGWFVVQMGCTLPYALTVCVIPFIPLDLVKIGLASALGSLLRRSLTRSEEHTSELQSRFDLVCRLLL